MEILDTRDLQKRLDELKAEHETLKDAVEEADQDDLQAAKDELKEFEESEEFTEMKELQGLSEEISEWKYGESLIPEDDFEEYCQELLSDIGDLPKDIPWYIEIDWEKTAQNIKMDYSEVEYLGTTYLYRS